MRAHIASVNRRKFPQIVYPGFLKMPIHAPMKEKMRERSHIMGSKFMTPLEQEEDGEKKLWRTSRDVA